MTAIARLLRGLAGSRSGLAATELALSLPFLLGAGLWAVELSNYALTTMQINQIAATLADNASRIGEKSKLEERQIYEDDIDDLLQGASLQGGKTMQIFDHGRAIISSLENNNGDQYIHWQRCMGELNWTSSYGEEGDVLPDGMGPTGEEVYAPKDEAVIFVEVAYDYQPLISKRFIGNPRIRSIASFIVRNSRDLSKIYKRDSSDPEAKCDKYENRYPV